MRKFADKTQDSICLGMHNEMVQFLNRYFAFEKEHQTSANYVCRAYLQVFKYLFSESRFPSFGSEVGPHWRSALAGK